MSLGPQKINVSVSGERRHLAWADRSRVDPADVENTGSTRLRVAPVGYKGPRQGTGPLSYQLLRPVGCPGLAMPRPGAPWGFGRPAARPGARPPPRARRPRALEQAVAIRVTLPDGQLGVSPIFAGASSRIWARLPRRCWSCCGRRTKTRGCRHAVRSSIGRSGGRRLQSMRRTLGSISASFI